MPPVVVVVVIKTFESLRELSKALQNCLSVCELATSALAIQCCADFLIATLKSMV